MVRGNGDESGEGAVERPGVPLHSKDDQILLVVLVRAPVWCLRVMNMNR